MKPIRRKTRLESEDERKTSKEWRDLGYVELKIMACNHDGWPDRWYRGLDMPFGFWCEWKRTDTDAEEHQIEKHRALRANGEIVIVAHSRRDFWEQVRALKADNGL